MRHLRVLLVCLASILGVVEPASVVLDGTNDNIAWNSPVTDGSGNTKGYQPLTGLTSVFNARKGGLYRRKWTMFYSDSVKAGLGNGAYEAPGPGAHSGNLYAKYAGKFYRYWWRNTNHFAGRGVAWWDDGKFVIGMEGSVDVDDRLFKLKTVDFKSSQYFARGCRWLGYPRSSFYRIDDMKCKGGEVVTGMRFFYDLLFRTRQIQTRCCTVEECSNKCKTCSGTADNCLSCPNSAMSVVDGACRCSALTDIMVFDSVQQAWKCEACQTGFRSMASGEVCTNINECTDTVFKHQCNGGRQCVDRVGSYECHCPKGWSYNTNGRKFGDANEACDVEDTLVWAVDPASDGVQVHLQGPSIWEATYNVSIYNDQGTISTLLEGFPRKSGKNGKDFSIMDLQAGKMFKLSVAVCQKDRVAEECIWDSRMRKSGPVSTTCGCDASAPRSAEWEPGYREITMSSTYLESSQHHCSDKKAGTNCWTNIEVDPWIRVDLGARHTIYEVAVAEGWWPTGHNDLTMENARHGKIQIWVSDFPSNYKKSGFIEMQGKVCREWTVAENNQQPRFVPFACEGNGRYVTLLAPGVDRSLKIAELRIGLGLSPLSNMFCKTREGGTAPADTPCSFPFVLDGISYDQCTITGNGNTPWCMVAGEGNLRGDCNCEYCHTVEGSGTVHGNSPCVFPFFVDGVEYYGPVTGVVPGGPSVGSEQTWCSVTQIYAGAWGTASCNSESSSLIDPLVRADMMDEQPVCLIKNTNKVCGFPFIHDGQQNLRCSKQTRPDGRTPAGSESWCYSEDGASFGDCDCSMAPGYVVAEKTGSPGNFKVFQEFGKMYYQWVDKSMCEEGFTFFRRTADARISISDDYIFKAEEKCGQRHRPQFVHEDIKDAGLSLGTELQYCMASIGNTGALMKYVSAESCFGTQVMFETMITGRVATSRDKGDMSMKGARIDWRCGSQTGSQATNAEGIYKIHLITDKIDALEEEMELSISGQTGNVTHKYLCDKVIPCASKTIKVKHLVFDHVVDFIDDTVNPLSGFVYIANTEHRGLDNGCPLSEVTVCLHSYPDTDTIFTCVNTTHTGEYLLPAVIGTTVAIELTYIKEDLHDFMRVGASPAGNGTDIDDVEHWLIDAESTYEFIDYSDITTAEMRVEVAGGLCSRDLGDAFIRVGIPHCPTWEWTIKQERMGENYEVPAHTIEVTLIEVQRYGKPRGEIGAYFEAVLGDKKTIGLDLTNLPATMDELAKPDLAYTFRFEYHPRPSLSIGFSENEESGCKQSDGSTQFVLKAGTLTDAYVYASEDFSDINIAKCTWVPGDVKITHSLGLSLEMVAMMKLNGGHAFTEDQMDILPTCHPDTPCYESLEPEERGVMLLAQDGDISQAGVDPSFIPSHCWDNDRSTLCKADPGEHPYLEIDLGRNQDISYVVVWPEEKIEGKDMRTKPEDLGKYEIWISDTPAVDVIDPYKKRQPIKCADGDLTAETSFDGPFIHNCIGNGRYVRIELPGSNRQLWFADLQAYSPSFQNSRAEISLLPAQPERSPMALSKEDPHTIQFYTSLHILPWPATVYRAKVVVIGDVPIKKNEKMQFPKEKPLTVIHDPPGGLSFSEYGGLKAKLADTVMGAEKLQAWFVNITLGKGSSAKKLGQHGEGEDAKLPNRDVCAPIIGFPGLPFACADMPFGAEPAEAEMFQLVVGNKNIQGDFDLNWHDKSGISINIDFKTDTNIGTPGASSDVFVVPGASILFVETRVVGYDFVNCKSTYYDVMRWTLQPEYQTPVLMFFRQDEIQKQELATLHKANQSEYDKRNRLYAEIEACKNEPESCDETFNATEAQETIDGDIAEKIEILGTNIANWDKMLDHNAALRDKAEAGELEFKGKGVFKQPTALANDQHSVASLINPYSMNYKNLDAMWTSGGEDEDQKVLSKFAGVTEMKISGGGSTYEYSEEIETHPQKKKSEHDKEDIEGFDVSISGGVASFTLSGAGGVRWSKKQTHSKSTEQVAKQTRGFTLGDPDIGDVFVVRIFTDPDFDTFYFYTKGGASMCPHEPFTDARQQPRISVTGSPITKPLPNQAAVFNLEVHNDGDETHDFILWSDIKTNKHGLELTVDGNPIWTPLEYDQMPPGAYPVTLLARKGKGYKFEGVNIIFASMCEYKRFFPESTLFTDDWMKSETSLTVEFLKICPRVEVSGVLKFDQWFQVNKTDANWEYVWEEGNSKLRPNSVRVEGFNANVFTDGLWSDEERLQGVWVEFKEESEKDWQYARDINGSKLNLVIEENEYGFSYADWYVASIPDGLYRLRLRSECTPSGTGVEAADMYISDEIPGLVDRRNPVQFGPVTPADGEYIPGKQVGVAFNEDIRCDLPYRFEVNMEVEGLDQTFEKRNMVIVCEHNRIGVHFKSSVPYDLVMGRFATVTFAMIEDEANNELPTPAVAEFQFGEIELHQVSVIMEEVFLKIPYETGMEDLASNAALAITAPIITEFTQRSGLAPEDAYRIQVTKIEDGGDGIYIDWRFGADEAGDVVSKTSTELIEVLRDLRENMDCKSGSEDEFTMMCKTLSDEAFVGEVVGKRLKIDGAGPCPDIEWEESILKKGEMIGNIMLGSQVMVQAVNPGENRWEDFSRVQKVGCEYRKHGGPWLPCLDMEGEEINFLAGEYNHQANSWWDIDDAMQGKLESHLFTECRAFNGLPSADDRAFSSSLFITLDTIPPMKFGVIEPQIYFPGATLKMAFSEAISCHEAQIDLSASGSFSLQGMQTSTGCEDNILKIGFPAMDTDLFKWVQGEKVAVTVTGVRDSAGNLQDGTVYGSFTFGTLGHNVQTASITSDRFQTEAVTADLGGVSVTEAPESTASFILEMAALAIVNSLLIAAIFVRCLTKKN